VQYAPIVAHKEIALPKHGEKLAQRCPATQVSYTGYLPHLRKHRLPKLSLLCTPEQHYLGSICDEVIGQPGEARSGPASRRGIRPRARMERDQRVGTVP
jgi:hypothetical protein